MLTTEWLLNAVRVRISTFPWITALKRCGVALVALLAPASPAPDWLPRYEWTAGEPFDKSAWTFETGFLRNEEQQYYTGGNSQNFDEATTGLRFIARRETVPNAAFRPGSRYWIMARPSANFTSTSIVSKEAWRNFRVEVVASVAGGKGAWPAIWLRGNNSDGFSEVDLMEQLGREPEIVHSTMHYGPTLAARKSVSADTTIRGLQGRDVVYAAELSPRHVAIQINGRHLLWTDRKMTMGSTRPFEQSFNLVINLALGSAWAGPVDEKALPALMTIKSIRIFDWRHKPGSAREKVAAASRP